MAAKQVTLKEYFAATGSIYTDADAQKIGPVLEKLAEQGRSTPKQIVEAAKNEKSPLHGYFEWHDDIAAQLYREDQARYMARSIQVKVVDTEGVEREARAFYSAKVVPIENTEAKRGSKQYQYVTIDTVMQDQQIADQVIKDALGQLVSWKNKYSIYRALFKGYWQLDIVFDTISNLEEQVNI